MTAQNSSCVKLDSSTFFGGRVGLLGGTFDPVHNGHLVIAHAVHQKLNLDSVLFVPAASPPHKVDYAITPFEDRCRMLEMALADQPELYFTRMEEERSGPSFSIDTLSFLRERFPDTHFYFVVGSDAFADIGTWKRFHHIPNYCDIVVILRGGAAGPDPAATVARAYPDFVLCKKSGRWKSPHMKGGVLPMDLPPVDISSTMIRAMVRDNQSIEGMVPHPVAHYIQKGHLYLTAQADRLKAEDC